MGRAGSNNSGGVGKPGQSPMGSAMGPPGGGRASGQQNVGSG